MDLKEIFERRNFWNSRGVRFSKLVSDHREFTRKKSTKASRRAKRKMAKASRRRNR